MAQADSANAPYGAKTQDEILQLSIKNTELLLDKGCKMIVVACNTATTNAISYLRSQYKIPFIGIEPAIKPAALQSKSKTVGVLATKGTLASSLFHSTSENHAHGIQIIEQEGKGLVPLIEAGKENGEETEFLAPMLSAGIDYLVLGCTHYPYLIPALRALLPAHVKIIDSGEAVARQTKAVLEKTARVNKLNIAGESSFYTNGDTSILEYFLTDVNVNTIVKYLDF